ncbi:MAG TPA: diguanylate cyclase [Rhodocyclaceae bacterium]|nr:diguanylate cyclase [Rhodocyclaceae bacterium]
MKNKAPSPHSQLAARWSLLAGLLLLWAACIHAAPVRLSGEDISVPLADQVEFYEDASGRMDIGEVIERGAFSPAPRRSPPEAAPAALWLKLAFENPTPAPLARWLALPNLRGADVTFFLLKDGQWRSIRDDSRQPLARRAVTAASPAIPFDLPPAGTRTLYIRLAGPLPPAIAPVAWEPAAFRAMESHIRLVDGLLLGGLAVMGLAGVLFVFMFRERAFAFNALATATYFLGEANAKGYASLYLWPDATEWAGRCLPLFALLGVGFNILLVRDLLATRRQFPRADRLLLGLLALQWLPGIGVLFGNIRMWAGIAFSLNFPITVVLLLLGFHAMAKGIHAARYYTAAYGVLAMGSLFHGLSMAGKLSAGWSGEYALPLAMLAANALLMASVVDRVMQAKKDKALAQEALLSAHATYEAHLAEEVQTRTAELETAYERLQGSKQFVKSVLDSVSSQIAVVDETGTVVASNDAWRRFIQEIGCRAGGDAGGGLNYLDMIEAAGESAEADCADLAAGIRAVIDGRLPAFSREYACPLSGKPRWFMMTVTPLTAAGKGAVIVHTDISERKRMEDEIHQLAFFDPLTNLLNRRPLQDRLALARAANRRSGRYSAFLMLDLDNFKTLNDTHGHAVGDLLLVEVANRLKECVRATDTVARLGGDEFVVIVGELSADAADSRRQAEGVADKIISRLSEPYRLTLHQAGKDERTIEHACSASVGAALFNGDSDGDEIMAQADAAMYRAKAAGRHCVRFHESARHSETA